MPRPAAGVHAARIERDLVFLDLPNNSYFCMVDAFAGRADDRPTADIHMTESALAELVTSGMAIEEKQAAHRTLSDSPSPEWRSLPAVPRGGFSWHSLMRFLVALLLTIVLYVRRPLQHIVENVGEVAESPHLTADDVALERYELLVCQFDRLAAWLPFRPQCLFRSLWLLRFLRLNGLGADWIFGVRLYPFAAHCWLGTGSHVIGDKPFRLLGYAPILAIRG